ncbi:MAG: hypothetical protein AB7I27_19560 [Bacteriovoracaceae bacterium]
MRNLFFAAVLSFISISALACSVSVNDNFQKNLLIALGASHLDIPLTKVSATTLSGYVKSFEGADPVSECPQHLVTAASIHFKYSPSLYQTCEANVTVNRNYFIGEIPDGPIEQVNFSGMSASCSTTIPRICLPGRRC